MRIGFGPFAFDPQSRLLWRDETEIALPPRVLGILELLLERPGQVISRQDLLDRVWKDAFVTDTSLAEAVSFLRQALGDDPQAPRYIQTVHRRGYRFLALLTTTAPALAGTGPADQGVRLTTGEPVVGRGVEPPLAVKPSITGELLPWSVAVVCIALTMAAVRHILIQPTPDPAPIARFELRLPDAVSFERTAPAIAVSPDGRVLAWSACDAAACALYVRPIDRLEATRLAGTDGATSPAFSPDGRWIAFFADGKLKKIATSGGSASVLADAPAPGGADWAPDNRIVFAGLPAGGLSLVSDQGGAVTMLTRPRRERGELRHLFPSWVPGAGGVVFTIALSPLPGAPGELSALPVPPRSIPPASASSPPGWTTIRAGVTRGTPAGHGYLLLSNGHDLQAATFDERTLALTGGADSVLASLAGAGSIEQFAVSEGGTLAALEAAPRGRVTWSDRSDGDVAWPARLTSVTLSPDGRRAAGVVTDGGESDIWIADVLSGALTRLTFGGTNVSPAWSADSAHLFFATRSGSGSFSVASRGVDDRSSPQIIPSGANLLPGSVAADGRIAVTAPLPSGQTAVGIVPAGGGAPQLFNDGPFDEASPALSPDGRWVAFASDESGRPEIFVRDLRDGRRAAVSTDGGTRPRWSRDGRALYFDAGRRLMRVAFAPERDPHGSAPEPIFDRPGSSVVAVTSDGRLLVASRATAPDAALVVLQWLRELRQRLPAPLTAPR